MKRLTDIIVKETPSLEGIVKAPPSKSFTHRAFIASTLSPGVSVIKDPLICDDTLATLDACRMLGAKIRQKEAGIFEIQGRSKPLTPEDVINCRDSASTIRFLTPVCALAEGISVLTGGESLRRRPIGPLLDAMRQLGIRCYSTRGDGCPPVVVFGGGIKGGRASIRGDVSSQFVSGLLFATPMAQGDTDIEMTTALESKPYVEITMSILRSHGIEVEADPDFRSFHVPCDQRYAPSNHMIEGDYSSAAFLLAAAAITDSKIRVTNLREDSLQGDRIIVSLLKKMGVKIGVGKNFVEVEGAETHLQPFDADLRDNPDLVPVCAAVACFAYGRSVIRGVKRLRFKESDRVAALLGELTKMGVKIRFVNDAIEIESDGRPHGADLSSHDDHRIAMACIVSALGAEGKSVIRGVECINKSYPNFVTNIISLGAEIVER
ncbi:3-phosphoshikimate 1-carboxyvinyltransferase [Candidatus Bathyarchaeota archaeon]|nr:MAG: 3-phosphoshikimate 1-carboxyvinyltransferase [Candidatus Bathyarchaeota archaeon]